MAQLTTVVRKGDGSLLVLDAETSAEFLKTGLTSPEGLASVAVQAFVWPKGGDRAVWRSIYCISKVPRQPPITVTLRIPEVLSPEAGDRPEHAPVRSFQDSINGVLEELARRAIVQLEGGLRTRVTYLALDFVVDESDTPQLLWPHELRTLDVKADGTAEVPVEEAPPPPPPPPPPAARPPRAAGPSAAQRAAAEEEDWAAEKARAAAAAAAREEALRAEYASLLGRAVGEGARGAILVVDVDAGAVVPAARILAAAGFSVTVMDDGPKALALTRATNFDCMLLAKDLPSLSGIEVVRLLRAREAGLQRSRPGVSGRIAYHLPVVAFTGSTGPEDLQAYMAVGFDGCVAKPLDGDALLSTMAAAVPAPPHLAARPPPTMAALEAEALARAGGGGGGLLAINIPAAPSSPLASRGGDARASRGGLSLQVPPSPLVADGFEPFAGGEAPPSTAGGPGSPGLQGVRGARSMAAARRSARSPKRGAGASPRRTGGGGGGGGGGGTVTLGADGNVTMPAGAAIPGIPPPAGASVAPGRGATAGVTAGLPVPEDAEGSTLGIFQLDAETAVPYCVMGKRRPGAPVFHFVVVNDIFDTYEQHQILFKKMVAALPGLRVLLFNCPGQAYTEWRRDIVLNNEYLAGVLQALMTYVGPGGTREFDLDGGVAPFHLVGLGNGGAVATYFAAAYAGSHPALRSIVLVNGFAHVDSHFAGVMHDCACL